MILKKTSLMGRSGTHSHFSSLIRDRAGRLSTTMRAALDPSHRESTHAGDSQSGAHHIL